MAPIGTGIIASLSTLEESKTTLGPRHELLRRAGEIFVSISPQTKTMPYMVEDSYPEANFSLISGNSSGISAGRGTASHDDATWILTSAFIIFTMQSGRRELLAWGFPASEFSCLFLLRQSMINKEKWSCNNGGNSKRKQRSNSILV